MADSIGTLIATLEADVSGFQQGIARAQATLTNLESALNGKATPAIEKMQRGSVAAGRAGRILTNSMTSLAVSAASVPGPIGRISAAMLGLQLSIPVLVAIAAAVAAVAYVLNRAEKAADDLAKALQFGRDRRGREMTVVASIGNDEDVRRLGTLRARITELKDTIAGLRATRMLGDIELTPATEAETTLVARLQAVEEAAGSLAHTVQQDAVQALAEAQLRLEMVGQPLTTVEDAVRRLRLQFAGYPADVAGAITANERLAMTLTAIADGERALAAVEAAHGGLAGAQRRILDASGDVRLRGADPFAIPPEVFTQQELDLRRQIEGTFEDSEFQQRLKQLGVSLGRQLMMGLMEGIENMQDVLRSIFMAVLDFALGSILGGLLGGPAGAVAGGVGKSVGSVSKSVMGAGIPQASMSLPPMQPATAFFVARDPAFQQVYREAALVASAAGFR